MKLTANNFSNKKIPALAAGSIPVGFPAQAVQML
jgi:hypothetical protein